MQPSSSKHTPEKAPVRRPWSAPRVSDLPRLTELTLQTGPGIPGGGGDASTVF